MSEFKCKRCGLCCVSVGSTFWAHGDFEQWPELKRQAETVELSGDDAMPCQMLWITNGMAWCMIELRYGREAKPQVCREHPDGEKCQHEKQFE